MQAAATGGGGAAADVRMLLAPAAATSSESPPPPSSSASPPPTGPVAALPAGSVPASASRPAKPKLASAAAAAAAEPPGGATCTKNPGVCTRPDRHVGRCNLGGKPKGGSKRKGAAAEDGGGVGGGAKKRGAKAAAVGRTLPSRQKVGVRRVDQNLSGDAYIDALIELAHNQSEIIRARQAAEAKAEARGAGSRPSVLMNGSPLPAARAAQKHRVYEMLAGPQAEEPLPARARIRRAARRGGIVPLHQAGAAAPHQQRYASLDWAGAISVLQAPPARLDTCPLAVAKSEAAAAARVARAAAAREEGAPPRTHARTHPHCPLMAGLLMRGRPPPSWVDRSTGKDKMPKEKG